MQAQTNPYEPPGSSVAEAAPVYSIEQVGPGKRFLNFIIDYICYMVYSIIIGALIGIIFGRKGIDLVKSIPSFLFGMPLLLSYYLFWEGIFQRTPGKFVTGTIVVEENGMKPTFLKIVGRSFARFIPFEAFSFFGSESRGWHDSASKTFVVKCR